jgi:hypothetical protein
MNAWLDLKTLVTGLILSVAGWFGVIARDRLRVRREGKAIEQWLHANTRDEPGESHRTITYIAHNLGLPEDRVNKAIAQSRVIFRSKKNVDQVSIWRQEPQSVYEKRGILRV